MARGKCGGTVVAVAALVLMLTPGCAYLKDRGNDLADTFELGITVTPRATPTVAFRVNAFSLLSFGYSDSDLCMLGWSDRQVGKLRLRDEFGAFFIGGEEKIWIGRDGDELPTEGYIPHTLLPFDERERYSVGVVGVLQGERGPPARAFGECPKLLHLGWIGLYANCSLFDVADFFVGWSTIDIGSDDTAR